MSKFAWQKQRKKESVGSILRRIAYGGPESFTVLLKDTGLSRAVLAKRLKDLVKSGDLEKFLTNDGEIHYILTARALKDFLPLLKVQHFGLASYGFFSPISAMTDDSSISLKEFLKVFTEKIGVYTLYVLMQVLYIENPTEADLWLHDLLATDEEKGRLLCFLSERANMDSRRKTALSVADLSDISKLRASVQNKESLKTMLETLNELYPKNVQFLNNAMESSVAWADFIEDFSQGKLTKEEMSAPLKDVLEKYAKRRG